MFAIPEFFSKDLTNDILVLVGRAGGKIAAKIQFNCVDIHWYISPDLSPDYILSGIDRDQIHSILIKMLILLLSVSNSFIGILPLKGTGDKYGIHSLNCGTYSYRG